jgi:hypothetical protein
MLLNITVNGSGQVSAVSVASGTNHLGQGSGYVVGDSIGCASIGSGSGFAATISAYVPNTFGDVYNSGGALIQNGYCTNLRLGYLNSSYGLNIVAAQNNQFLAHTHSKYPAWLLVPGVSQWALWSGDLSTYPGNQYQTWFGNVNFNA